MGPSATSELVGTPSDVAADADPVPEATPGAEPNGGSGRRHPHPRRRRRRRLLISLLAIGLALPIGGYAMWGWIREDATPVSLADASERFRAEHPEAAAPSGPFLPAEGVYEYRGRGSDAISLPPLTQDHGPVMPGTVTHGDDGCFTFRIDYSSHHWEDWTYCPGPGGLAERGGHTLQRWDLGLDTIENRSDFACRAPTLVTGMQPGDEWTQTCTGRNDAIPGTTTSTGPMRFVGVEQMRIGGERVDAFHLVKDREVSGGQRGTLHADLWFAANGLPLRERHTVEVATSSPVGDIDYDETTDFRLVSLEPRR